MTNILGIDYGSKRIGLAFADTGVKIAVPLEVIDVEDLLDLRKIPATPDSLSPLITPFSTVNDALASPPSEKRASELALVDPEGCEVLRKSSIDNKVLDKILEIIKDRNIDKVVVGYPRNMSGETTQQTEEVINFAEKLRAKNVDVVYQDETLTSVISEDYLRNKKSNKNKKINKSDIDSHSAMIILTDYIEGSL
jgi:putative Holliday junction resolvase